MTEQDTCPNCGETGLWRESVDVGVGVIYGPYGCDCCGWSEDEAYNLASGPKVSDTGAPVDQWGGVYPGMGRLPTIAEPFDFDNLEVKTDLE